MYDDHVSVLQKYMEKENITTKDIQAWVRQHTWNRSQVFSMVSHGNHGRPCITNSDPVPGKPCVFPFVYPDCSVVPPPKICLTEGRKMPVVATKCLNDGSIEWCSTRTHWNNTHITGQYGRCSPHCKQHAHSTENLASADFQDLWEEQFYLLISDYIGHCHTYNSRHRSSAADEEKFIALLGEIKGFGD